MTPIIPRDPRIGAYLFDLDGTLSDTETCWVPALCELLRDDGHDLSLADSGTIILGRSWNSVYADIVARFPDEDTGSADLADRLRPYFLRHRDASDIRIPGSVEMVLAVAAHTPCAIVSGSCLRDVEETLERIGLRDSFTLLLGAEQVSRGKPDPMGYLLAAERLGVAPERCVVLEDSAAGVRSGKAAGMRVVALVRPDAPPQDVRPFANLCVSSLADFTPEALFHAQNEAVSSTTLENKCI